MARIEGLLFVTVAVFLLAIPSTCVPCAKEGESNGSTFLESTNRFY
jgi:hypothetical protein